VEGDPILMVKKSFQRARAESTIHTVVALKSPGQRSGKAYSIRGWHHSTVTSSNRDATVVTDEQRQNWKLAGGGFGIHWSEIKD